MPAKTDVPASDAQRRFMKKLGLAYARDITKAQAIDLIGTALEPEKETVEILKFFRVSAKGMHQTKARHRLAEIMADADSRRRWDERPAKADQLEQLAFYGEELPRGITHAAAERRINEIREDCSKADAWDAVVEKRENAASDMDDLVEAAQEYSTEYGCRKLGKKLARAAVQALMAEGITAETIDAQLYAPMYRKASEMDPSIVKDRKEFERGLLIAVAAAKPVAAQGAHIEAQRSVTIVPLRKGVAWRGWLWILLLVAIFAAMVSLSGR
jgi:hypothetical protein